MLPGCLAITLYFYMLRILASLVGVLAAITRRVKNALKQRPLRLRREQTIEDLAFNFQSLETWEEQL